MARNILIFGATSAIAHAIARRYAVDGANFVLIARDVTKLAANAADLSVRGAGNAITIVADLNEFPAQAELVSRAFSELGSLDVVLIAHGTLPDQERCCNEADEMRLAICTNLVSVVNLATLTATRLEQQRRGSLVVLGSVAGDRGRRSNYVYGAAKAGVAVFLEGLGARLLPHGVHVLTVKPGFVDTPMTAGFKKSGLWATPEQVAKAVCRAVDQRRRVIYVPWFWRPIMFLVRALPSGILARLKI